MVRLYKYIIAACTLPLEAVAFTSFVQSVVVKKEGVKLEVKTEDDQKVVLGQDKLTRRAKGIFPG